MATFASQLNYTPKILDDAAKKNMSPYIPGITTPSVAQTPSPATTAQVLRSQQTQVKASPSPAQPKQKPPAAPVVPPPAPVVPPAAQTTQPIVQATPPVSPPTQADVVNQSMNTPGQLVVGAATGEVSPSGQPVTFQSFTNNAAPAPTGPTYYDPVLDKMVAGDINEVRPWEKYGLASQSAYYNTDPASLQAKLLRGSAGNAKRLAEFTPSVASIGGGKFGYGEAGLIAPKREEFATVEEFQKANEDYNLMKLREQQMIANSPQVREARIQEEENLARDMYQAKLAQADYRRAQEKQRNDQQRQSLLQSLALRGLTPETDEFARNKLEEFNRLAAKSEEAAAAEGMISYAEAMGQAKTGATQRQSALVKQISDDIQKAVDALAKKEKTAIEWSKLSLAEKKAEVDKAYKEGRITLQERDQLRKEAETEANVSLKGAQTEKTEAQTERLDTLTPLEAEKMQAGTAKTIAETKRIETLTPLQAKQLAAKISKSLSSSGQKPASQADTTAAYEFHVATYGSKPTEKDLAAGVRYLRDTGQLEAPKEAAKKLVDAQAERKKTITPPKNSGSGNTDALLSLITGK